MGLPCLGLYSFGVPTAGFSLLALFPPGTPDKLVNRSGRPGRMTATLSAITSAVRAVDERNRCRFRDRRRNPVP